MHRRTRPWYHSHHWRSSAVFELFCHDSSHHVFSTMNSHISLFGLYRNCNFWMCIPVKLTKKQIHIPTYLGEMPMINYPPTKITRPQDVPCHSWHMRAKLICVSRLSNWYFLSPLSQVSLNVFVFQAFFWKNQPQFHMETWLVICQVSLVFIHGLLRNSLRF